MAGVVCIVAALFLGLFALVSFRLAELWFKFIPVFFTFGLFALGVYLILKWRSSFSKRARFLIVFFVSALIVGPIILDVYIRYERKTLQARAKEFLLRPIPKLLVPDSEGYVGGYFVDTNAGPANGVFGYSRILIERYATNGRIRWSAVIQGQFACTGEGVNPNIRSDAIDTNEEVRRYLAERNAILGKEWRMGFWQWVEDTMEMKQTIPEIEEEDQFNGFMRQMDGTWTNQSGSMTIEPNGRFFAAWINQNHTNVYVGTHVFRGKDSVLLVYPDNSSVGEKKEYRIIHLDEHSLIYEMDGQTNFMSR